MLVFVLLRWGSDSYVAGLLPSVLVVRSRRWRWLPEALFVAPTRHCAGPPVRLDGWTESQCLLVSYRPLAPQRIERQSAAFTAVQPAVTAGHSSGATTSSTPLSHRDARALDAGLARS